MAPLSFGPLGWPGPNCNFPLLITKNFLTHSGYGPLIVTWDDHGVHAYTYCTDARDSLWQWFTQFFLFNGALQIPPIHVYNIPLAGAGDHFSRFLAWSHSLCLGVAPDYDLWADSEFRGCFVIQVIQFYRDSGYVTPAAHGRPRPSHLAKVFLCLLSCIWGENN